MSQPAAPLETENKGTSPSAASNRKSSPRLSQPSQSTGSALLDSFSPPAIGGTTTLLMGQFTGQLVAPSELSFSQSSRPSAASTAALIATSTAVQSPDTARTAAVNRLTSVLKSDRASTKTIAQS